MHQDFSSMENILLLVVDDFTSQGRKVGFARIKVVINATEPLVPGVQIRGENTVLWQPFVYENIPGFCFRCGRIGHELEGCHYPPPRAEEELGRSLMVVETGEALGAEQLGGTAAPSSDRPSVFGPWLATTRIRPPRTTKTPSPATKAAGSSSGLDGTGEGRGKASCQPSSPDSPPDSAVWEKPTKVARRRSPPKEQEGGSGVLVCSVLGAFDPISDPELLEEDLHTAVGPEIVMVEAAASQHLKRPRSPRKSGQLQGKEELGAKRDGAVAAGSSGGVSGGHRLPDSWRKCLLVAAGGSPECQGREGPSEAKGKDRLEGAVGSLQTEGKCSGKEEDGCHAHSRAVWRAKEALGLQGVQLEPRHCQLGAQQQRSQAKTEKGKAQASLVVHPEISQVGARDGPSAGDQGPGLVRESQ